LAKPSSSIAPQALRTIALALHRAGNAAEAASLYRQILPALPKDVELLYLAGTAELQCHRAAAAERLLSRLLAVCADHPHGLVNRGVARLKLQRPAEALEDFTRAVAAKPDDVDAHYNRGTVLLAFGRLGEALAEFDRVLELVPDHIGARNNRGNALRALHRPEEALAAYDAVATLDPAHVKGLYNRAVALTDLARPDEALVACDEVIARDPANAEAHCCRGNILRELGRRPEALAAYTQAETLNPNYADARWDRSLVELLLGDFAAGWRDFEARWQSAIPKAAIRTFDRPQWGGEPIAGKTILLHAEQGLGDTVQFCRYAALVAAAGAEVVLEVPLPLMPLLSTMPGDFTLIAAGAPPPAFDVHCPLMSLPLAFRTELSTIPAAVPYLFADPMRRAVWGQALGPKHRPRIGLVWSGRAGLAPDRTRSMSVAHLAPLLAQPYEFHCLQKMVRPADAEFLAASGRVRTHTQALRDFADTAGLIAEMDVTIAVDTSVAHVAGALGAPLWLMLPFAPDWRWLLDRTDSPWYPTATLFRQQTRGDWDGVVSGLVTALAARFG
jgi:tetratricopeptide (TPR) repeat protein